MQKVRREERRWNEMYWRAFMCPAVAFSRDGAYLVVAGPDHLLRRWETRTWTPLPPLAAHVKERQLLALAVSPSGSLLASADDHGDIVLWDADAWKSLATLPTQGAVAGLAFAPDGATLIAALKNGQLARVTGLAAKDTLKREIVATAKQPEQTPYQAEITSLAYDPHGALLATGGADHRVLLWDAKSFQQLRKLLFLSREGVERFLFEAHQRGLLEYHVAGSVTRLTFAANTLEEYANVLAQR
jgi:WD40 repeat protein